MRCELQLVCSSSRPAAGLAFHDTGLGIKLPLATLAGEPNT